jgi:hypothetical protein
MKKKHSNIVVTTSNAFGCPYQSFLGSFGGYNNLGSLGCKYTTEELVVAGVVVRLIFTTTSSSGTSMVVCRQYWRRDSIEESIVCSLFLVR